MGEAERSICGRPRRKRKTEQRECESFDRTDMVEIKYEDMQSGGRGTRKKLVTPSNNRVVGSKRSACLGEMAVAIKDDVCH